MTGRIVLLDGATGSDDVHAVMVVRGFPDDQVLCRTRAGVERLRVDLNPGPA